MLSSEPIQPETKEKKMIAVIEQRGKMLRRVQCTCADVEEKTAAVAKALLLAGKMEGGDFDIYAYRSVNAALADRCRHNPVDHLTGCI
jgi:hypothetical protein